MKMVLLLYLLVGVKVNRNPLVSVVVLTRNTEKQISRCINSILNSSYKHYEVIAVDSASTDRICDLISEKFPQVKLVKCKKDLLASGARNLGASFAKGEYVLFVDSDNVIDKDMILHLVKVAIENEIAGILGPKMYYLENPKMIWYAGADINLITSKTNYIGINTIDNGQFNEVKEVGHLPNVFMIKKKVFEKISGFDTENFPIHYEESDLAERIKKEGYKVLFVPHAITYHDTPLKIKQGKGKGLALNTRERAYYNFRNRILFMKKYGKNYLLFVLAFLPFFVSLYLLIALKIKRHDLLKSIILGVKDGLLREF